MNEPRACHTESFQIEKNKYQILTSEKQVSEREKQVSDTNIYIYTHIYMESRKVVPMNLFAGQE